MNVCDVEEEVTFKPTHNIQPSPHSLIIPVCNQPSMAESTPTAYTPNTLTGNLFSPGAFVCSFERQPENRGRDSSGKRQTEQKKNLRYKGKSKEAGSYKEKERTQKKGEKDRRDLIMLFMLLLFDGFISGSKASLTFFCTESREG